MKTKTCTKCGVEKPLEKFYYGKAECRLCLARYRQAWRLKQKSRPGPAAKDRPGPVAKDLPPGVIGLKEAAAMVQELTGLKCSASEMLTRARRFRHIARWRVGNNGADKLEGIDQARLIGLIQGRLAVRGRSVALKDLFSTEGI